MTTATCPRTCGSCAQYQPHDQWHGACRAHHADTEPDDTCEQWEERE